MMAGAAGLPVFSPYGAPGIARFLGPSGMSGLTGIMGFLLVCIGVQFVINGVDALVA